MISEARAYCDERQTTRREPIYSANRFARLVSDLPAARMTPDHLQRYRELCQTKGLSAKTIESSISDIVTVCRFVTGQSVNVGRRITIPKPDPQPVSLDTIDMVWPLADPWLQQWIILSYWTGLRLSDAMHLQTTLTGPASVLRFTAGKTGHRHGWPMPEWIRKWMSPQPLPFRTATDFATKILRACLVRHCRSANVDKFLPKNLRQRGLTEWMRADGTAGAIVHGCGLGVLKHYVDPITLLEPHVHRVRVPACFGADVAEDISVPFSRLDPDAQRLVRDTIKRFA